MLCGKRFGNAACEYEATSRRPGELRCGVEATTSRSKSPVRLVANASQILHVELDPPTELIVLDLQAVIA